MLVAVKNSVAIVGKGEGWREAPDGGEVWGVNDVVLRRDVALVFDMHDLRNVREWTGNFVGPPEKTTVFEATKGMILRRVRELGIDLLTLYAHPDVSNCVPYPLQEIVKHFGADYFRSSIDYMVAYAIYEGFTDIQIYGVHHVAEKEYRHQKPSLEFWLGVAKGSGIEVTVHGDSELLLTRDRRLYGYGTFQFRHKNGG